MGTLSYQMRDALIWNSSDVSVTYAQFRDRVITQTAKLMLERGTRRGAVASLEIGEDEVTP